jgi:glucosamine--fructose-6-phosphate aminotransferase (isomerizing)
VLVSDADPASTGCAISTHLAVPPVHRFVTPLVYAVPVQLIAYHTAVFMGTDVDQPRNLAKSVTVE